MVARDAVVSRIRRGPVVAGAIAMALGALLLQAYVFGVVPLVPTAVFMPLAQPLDAVLFVLTGAGLLSLRIQSKRLRQTSAGLATALAAALLVEYVLRVDLRIDSLLFPDQVAQLVPVFPGRPAPLSCAGFLLLNMLLLAPPRRGAHHGRHRAAAGHRRASGRRAGALRPGPRQRRGALRRDRAPDSRGRPHGGDARGRARAAAPERRAGYGAAPPVAAVRAGAP